MAGNGHGGQRWGLIVSAVRPDSPGESAGIMIGDILLDIDGRPVSATGHDFNVASNLAAGGESMLRVLRGGKIHDMVVTPQSV
jgi:serine protease DegQ